MANQQVKEEVEMLIFIGSNIFKLKEYFDKSREDEFSILVDSRDGRIISTDDSNHYKNRCILMYFQKSSIMEDKYFDTDLNSKSCSLIPPLFSSNFSETLAGFRIYLENSENLGSVEDLINSSKTNTNKEKSSLINKVVDETNKGIPLGNCNIVKKLFEGERNNSVKEVWVDTSTGEFYEKQNILCPYPKLNLYKRNGKVVLPKVGINLEYSAYKLFKNQEAYSNFLKTIKLIEKNLG